MNFKIITNRLELVPLSKKYLYSTHEYASDIETTKYMIFLPNHNLEQTSSFLEYVEKAWLNNNDTSDAILECAILYDGIHIGAVSIEINDGISEVGWILNRKYQKQGFAYEAASALIDYAISIYNIRKVIAHCDTRNTASFRLMEKLGLHRIKTQERIYQDERGSALEYEYELIIK